MTKTVAPLSNKQVMKRPSSRSDGGGKRIPAAFENNEPIVRALSQLAASGKATGARAEKVSVRVDPGILQAAGEQLGLASADTSDVINAALALAAAPDTFKLWWRHTQDTLPDDFELAI